jgi:hypothetical protein
VLPDESRVTRPANADILLKVGSIRIPLRHDPLRRLSTGPEISLT